MNDIKYNRPIAIAVLCVAVVLSVLFSGGAGLNKQNAKLNNLYVMGEDNDGLSLKYDLDRRGTAITKLIALANGYLPETDNDLSKLTELNSLLTGDKISERITASNEITASVVNVYEKLLKQNLSEDDKTQLKGLNREIADAQKTIADSNWFNMARGLRNDLNGFPASIIAPVFGIESPLNSDEV